MEAHSLQILRSQFREIFIKQWYSFQPVSDSPVIVDCGANIGMASLWFSLTFPKATILGYEADATLCNTARRNLTSAGCENAKIVHAAAWNCNGTLQFNATGDDRGAVAVDGAIAVPSVDLAQHLPARVDLLKIDIEGGEFVVLPHLCRSGALERVRNLAAEFHISRDHFDDFLKILRDLRQSGFILTFRGDVEDWLGVENVLSPFGSVASGKLFVQLYAWRE